MKKLVILGGSGIGMIAASIAETTGEYDVVGFLNDVVDVGTLIGKYRKLPVIGRTEDLSGLLRQQDMHVFIAYVGLQNEKQTFEKISSLAIPDDRFASLIHPSAIIPKGYVGLGKGILVAPLAQMSPDSTLSDNCLMLANSFLGHDSFMDRFAHLATNSVVGANVRVGKAVHVGSNATIREKVTIGDYSLIGAGSMVLNDVPENAVIVGNPAKVLKLR